MAYEVTKRIKGHDYRYAVEAYRDPQTNRRKTRWLYLGAIDNGQLRTPTARRNGPRVTRQAIVEATAQLLRFRDPSHITVGVIALAAGASRTAFYRHFKNQQEAMSEALDRLREELVQGLPAFEPPENLAGAKLQLRGWSHAFDRAIERLGVLQRILRQTQDRKVRFRVTPSTTVADASVPLSNFLQRLNDAGLASIDDPRALAATIKGMHLTLRIATALTASDHELPLPDHEHMYELIERAVFGNAR